MVTGATVRRVKGRTEKTEATASNIPELKRITDQVGPTQHPEETGIN